MYHSFNTTIAEKCGIAAATIFNHLYFWIEKNRANNENFFDGLYWTYSSVEGLTKIFSYLSPRQINYAIKKLIDCRLVVTGNYNTSPYNRTIWYAITKQGYCILQNCEMSETNFRNETDKIVKSNKDISTKIEAEDNIYSLSPGACACESVGDNPGDTEGDIVPTKRLEVEDNKHTPLSQLQRFIERWGVSANAIANYRGGKMAEIDWDKLSEKVEKSPFLQQRKNISFFINKYEEILDGTYDEWNDSGGGTRDKRKPLVDTTDPDFDISGLDKIHYD